MSFHNKNGSHGSDLRVDTGSSLRIIGFMYPILSYFNFILFYCKRYEERNRKVWVFHVDPQLNQNPSMYS